MDYFIKRNNITLDWFEFSKWGRVHNQRAKKSIIKWSSSAYGEQNFNYLEIQGRITVDMLPIIQRDYKFSSYKLDDVSEHFLGSNKDPVTPHDIYHAFHTKNVNEVTTVGKYCVQDTILPLKLFEKLQTWIALCEMAKITSVPIMYTFTRGQQVKVFS